MLNHSQPWITSAEKDAVSAVLLSGLLSHGNYASHLETALSQYLNKKYAFFTGNGSQAQALILAGIGLGSGDEVILPSYVCDKVFKAVKSVGAIPVLCDIGPNWVMVPEETEKKINAKTKAIILPHVYGINSWSNDFASFDIPIIEDVCQSLGHVNISNRTGTITDYSFTSFHGTKCIGAGEGGMLFVNDEEVFNKIVNTQQNNPVFTIGTDLSAAVAFAQFRRYGLILERRNEIAKFYNESISATLNRDYAQYTDRSMNYRYILRSNGNFEIIKERFHQSGIHVRKGIDNLIHRQIGMSDKDFPNSVACYNTSVSIPILPQFGTDDVELISETCNKLHAENAL